MNRIFETHKVRKQQDFGDCLWDFSVPERGTGHRNVLVPGCWEKVPGYENYRGTAVYRKSFTAGGNLRFLFEGVSHTASVFLDGQLLTSHYNAYTPFEALALQTEYGKHELKVEVSNAFQETSALHVPNDYMTYGGIIRPVVLEQLQEPAYLLSVHYRPFLQDGIWHCNVEAKCRIFREETMQNLSVQVTVPQLQQTIWLRPEKAEPSEHGCLVQSYAGSFTAADAQTWTMEHPVLYTAIAQLFVNEAEQPGQALQSPADDLIERVGFREVHCEGNRIMLNGKKVRIKGFCRHEDHESFGCALPVSVMEQDIQMLKEMRGNSFRTTHYPNDQRFLDLCDEQGVLVWEESHARGLSEKEMRNPYFEPQSEACIEEMVQAHANHPCIYTWGMLNECASETAFGRTLYEKQLRKFQEQDETRPRTFATCKFRTEDGVQIIDKCMDLPDITSFNVYPLWYFDTDIEKFFADLYREIRLKTSAEKPILISEVGAGAEYGYRDRAHAKWSEEYQADVLEQQLQAILTNENFSGVYIWQFADVRVSEEWFARRPRSHNNKGVVDEYRRPKLAYDIVRKMYASYPDYFA